MDIDPNQPWGIALDYVGRARQPVQEQGFSVDVWVADASPGQRDTPTVSAQIVVLDPNDWTAYQLGMVSKQAYSAGTWAPNPNVVQQAVAECVQQALDHLDWLASLRPQNP
ncbi:hypothetical protein AB0953_16415 [Streptomyces sp. NPDC046866]|uniref:hypothetical protein n=1 Tax=Streptomyces sp. NPDC046866 TaxID=3154921 RepID=UPI0034547C96